MTGCGVVAGVDLSGPAPGRDAPAPTETSFNLILSDAAGPTEVGAPPAPATRLPSTKALTDRLPPLPTAATAPAALRPGPKPPPITGTDRLAPFPPEGSDEAPVAPEAGPAGALHVTRRAPEGEIGVGASVTVSFDAPMVPVASVDEVSAVAPVQISPQPPGSWRWLGTKTAMFQAEGRLPAATVFTATLPAGTRAANGAALAAAESWTFSTPPVTLQSSWPSASETIGVSPVFILRFDQRVTPEAVLAHAALRAGRAQVPLALASEAEILESAGSWMWREAPKGTAVALRPARGSPARTSASSSAPTGRSRSPGPAAAGRSAGPTSQ